MIGNYTGQHGELNFEADFVEKLIEAGWEKDVIKNPSEKDLEENLRGIINRNNVDKLGLDTPLTDGEFGQVMDKINGCNTPVAANILLNGRDVAIRSEITRCGYKAGDEIYLFLFDPLEVAGGHSVYQIAEQPVFDAKNNSRRGDISLMVNGLPVIHIELKAAGHSLEEGVNQIEKYMSEGIFHGLFGLIQVFFVATPEDIIYFSNTCPKVDPAFLFHWGDECNNRISNWQELITGKNQILSIPEAHQLVAYYTSACIEKDSKGRIENVNNGILMVARSYQVHAIRNILRRIKAQPWGTHTPLGGYIWGTTGCGKTFTSYKTGQLVIDRNYADKVVFVVDRKELDDQSYKEYSSFSRDGEPIRRTTHTHDLFRALQNTSDRLIITSIQKLSRINEDKSAYVSQADIDRINKKRIMFIIDEAHRSQFGEMHGQVKATFVNAVFFGFTGTPIFMENDKKDGLTSETAFGECLAVYSIANGIRDGNVLGFDPRQVHTFKDEELKDAVACEKAMVRSKDEAKKDEKKWKIYREYYNLPMLGIEAWLPTAQYKCDTHRKAVVKDILDGWDLLSNVDGQIRFSALLATDSIPEAVEYFRLFKDTDLKVTALFDPSTNKDTRDVIDKEQALNEIVEHYNKMFGQAIDRKTDPHLKGFKSDVTARLAHKGPYRNIQKEEMIDIVIVVDQLLTGFDSKYLNTLYLDKVLETDALIQAVSRTNRVLDNEQKPFGIFKYYRKPYTMDYNIKEALRLYCEGENDCAMVKKIDENLKLANTAFYAIKAIFEAAGVKDFMALPESDAGKHMFVEMFRSLTKIINSMKLQGMRWKSDDDPHVKALAVCEKWTDGKARIFNVLTQRYIDFMSDKDRTRTLNPGRPGYSLIASLSEVEKDKIDADYLEEHFKLLLPNLVGDMDEMEKDLKVKEFQSQLAVLPAGQQEYANIIIGDIRDGRLVVEDMTLRELIAEYQEDVRNKKISVFAAKYGLDTALLYKACQTTGNRDMLISSLLDSCDRKNAEREFSTGWFMARAKLDGCIRGFCESV